MNKELTVYH